MQAPQRRGKQLGTIKMTAKTGKGTKQGAPPRQVWFIALSGRTFAKPTPALLGVAAGGISARSVAAIRYRLASRVGGMQSFCFSLGVYRKANCESLQSSLASNRSRTFSP